MRSKAVVTKNMGEWSEVLVMRSEACGSCSACNGCQAKPTLLKVRNTMSANPGDAVIVEMEDKRFFQSVGWLYVLPLVLFVGGIMLSAFIQQFFGQMNELLCVMGGAVGLFLFWLIIRVVDHRSERKTMISMVRKESLLSSIGEEPPSSFLTEGKRA